MIAYPVGKFPNETKSSRPDGVVGGGRDGEKDWDSYRQDLRLIPTNGLAEGGGVGRGKVGRELLAKE